MNSKYENELINKILLYVNLDRCCTGVCHVAVDDDVAVSTWPFDGADAFTFTVADPALKLLNNY